MDTVRKFIEPIRKKWIYHFIISPKTSIVEKPEWYLNQSLKWIHEHLDTVESSIKLGPNESDSRKVRRAFILCMLELSHRRLQKDLVTIGKRMDGGDSQMEKLLIHTYNEVVQYIRVIKQLLVDDYEDLDEKYDMMALFSSEKLFEKIVDAEWEYAKTNIREITSCSSKWDPILEGDYVDYYKIPRCVDRLLLQIKAISERVECFNQADCQFQLIELQCYLFKRFLDCMKKTTESSPISKNTFTDIFFMTDDSTIDLTKILRVLNGVNFLRLILKEKCFMPKRVLAGDDLDEDLAKKLRTTTEDYVSYMNRLIDRVITIYTQVDCDYEKFLDFVRPKLANNIYELVRDEAAKIHQGRQTESMLKNLPIG